MMMIYHIVIKIKGFLIMPRTIIDISDEQLRALDCLRAKRHQSRSSLIRKVLDEYLSEHRADWPKEAFGIWRDKPVDALAYEDKLRSEWKT
jgi:hypothetical protein